MATKLRRFITYLGCLALAVCGLTNKGISQEISTQGTEFYTVYMANFPDWMLNTNERGVLISAKRTCRVTIQNIRTGFYLANNVTVPAGQIKQFCVKAQNPNNEGQAYLTDYTAIPRDKSLRITATDTITVYSYNYESASFDGSVVLPTPSLGDYYIIHTSDPADDGHSVFSVTAVEPGTTTVDVWPSAIVKNNAGTNYGPAGASYVSGQQWVSTGWGRGYWRDTYSTITRDTMITVVLQQGQSFELGSVSMEADGNLTGTRVMSRGGKKIAVNNGNDWTEIIHPWTCSDHVYEQAFPVSTWGKKFVVTGTQHRCEDLLRMTASEDGTLITINGGAPIALNAFQTHQRTFRSDQAYYIESNKPIAVYTYIASLTYAANGCRSNNFGDPAMVWIAPLEQRINEMHFSTFMPVHSLARDENAPTEHYVNIVTPADATVTLDGVNITSQFTTVPNNTGYKYVRKQITHNDHTLTSSKGLIAHCYGIGYYVSYAYNIGSAMKDLTGNIVINRDTLAQSTVKHYCLGDTVKVSYFFEGDADSVQWSLNGETFRRHTPDDTLRFIPRRAHLGENTISMKVYYSQNSGSMHRSFQATNIFYIHDTAHVDTTAASCGSYEWRGTSYSASGVYPKHFLTAYGCDSVRALHLTINPHTQKTISVAECQEYSWSVTDLGGSVHN